MMWSEEVRARLETWLRRGYIKGSIGAPDVRAGVRAALGEVERLRLALALAEDRAHTALQGYHLVREELDRRMGE